ncbi:MAG TPA: MFS transporter [Chloroflexi bacterium]|nr:MFS transporter [Chloroflexota bacterium]
MTISEMDIPAQEKPALLNTPGKWRTLVLLSVAELLGMAVWFSASAVVPALTDIWSLSDGDKAWLTMSVQIGFVIGSLVSAIFNLADRWPSRRLFASSSLMAGVTTALIAVVANSLWVALILRFFTGVFLAGVYPVGMKIMATWTKRDRGLGIGLLVGALVLGSASPHLLNALGGVNDWRPVMYLAAASAGFGAVIGILFITEGPYQSPAPRFQWRQVGRILAEKDIALANLGYLGHMWELYAMWAWIPLFILISFEERGINPTWASLAAFAIIAVGGIGSFIAGPLADRFGRTLVTSVSLIISGTSALLIGFLFGGNPIALVTLALIWGFAVVADSAQFSAAVSELSPPKYVGTALTLQTSLGFLLTLFSIRLIPPLVDLIGWRFAFSSLAFGPLIGVWAMLALRRLPNADKLARGQK